MDTNTIGYTGKVSITQDNKILYSNHNAGTSSLFSLLCSLLAVSQSNYSCYPAYISIISGAITTDDIDYAEVQTRSILVNEITITNRTITAADKVNMPKLKLSGLLTYDNLKSLNNNANQYSIMLIDSTKTRILAYSIVDGRNSENLTLIKESKLNQASVNWELTFANSN